MTPKCVAWSCQCTRAAVDRALRLDRAVCRQEALKLGWEAIANQFLHALVPINCDKFPAMKEAQWQSQAIPA